MIFMENGLGVGIRIRNRVNIPLGKKGLSIQHRGFNENAISFSSLNSIINIRKISKKNKIK